MDKDYDELDHALNNLMWVWSQYGEGSHDRHDENGKLVSVYLEHRCMQAGEQAGEMLEKHGLAVDIGWGLELTEKGIALYLKDFG